MGPQHTHTHTANMQVGKYAYVKPHGIPAGHKGAKNKGM